MLNNVVNPQCLRYFDMMKNDEYLIVFGISGKIKASFFKKENEIYEYFHLFNIKKISEYKKFKYPISFLFRNEPFADKYQYNICDHKTWAEKIRESNLTEVKKQLEKDDDNNAKLIYKKILTDGGKFVTFDEYRVTHGGLLVCAVASDEDYYWVYVDFDLNICLSSCVGKYDFIDSKAKHFTELRQMIEEHPEELYEKILKCFGRSSDAIFTPVIISNELKKEVDYEKG